MSEKKFAGLLLLGVVLLLLAVLLTGCTPEPQIRPQIDVGELPADWQRLFGDDNGSKLNLVQHRNIFGFNERQPDGKMVHKRGLIERITVLEGVVDNLRRDMDAAKKPVIKPIVKIAPAGIDELINANEVVK